MGKEGGSAGRVVGEDMDFIPNMIRAKRASVGRIGEMLIGGTEVSVSRKGFILETQAQEIVRVWESGEESEIESGNEKICPEEVGREERNVGGESTGVRWRGGWADRATSESRDGRA